MSALFSPFMIRGLTLPNRIIVSPMCQYAPAQLVATIEAPPQYWRSHPRGLEGLFGNVTLGL
jgi:2,4-dienoyl-CoA reductase-like NADH-dependent reductase (Old Yellow Enzyme family)